MHESAILIRGDQWKTPRKQLPYVEDEMQQVGKLLREQEVLVAGPLTRHDDFVMEIRRLNEERKNLRLIHYSGHFDNNALELSEEEAITVAILEANNLKFLTQPLVFLNGCASGRLENLWEKSRNLSTVFLARGAGACVVSLLKMENLTAGRFAQKFYEHFLADGTTAAEALRRTRQEMKSRELFRGYDPAYDVTRYFYHLYGDPTLVF
jgi:CHAT domain-containing protein